MTDSTLVVPADLKTEIEERSRIEQRSEADIIRDALRQYVEHQPASLSSPLPGDTSDSLNDKGYVKASWMLDPRVPQSIGIAKSGRIQSDEVDEWLDKNWERDW